MKNKKKPQPAKKSSPKKVAPRKVAAKKAPAKKPTGIKAVAAKAKSTVQKVASAAKAVAKAATAAPKKNPFVPEGAAWVNVYLNVSNVRDSIDFCVKAFGMKEVGAMPGPDGVIMHGEVAHEGQRIMMGPASPMWQTKTPKEFGSASYGVYVYTRDVDKIYDRALAAGAVSIRKPEDQFYGDRTCMVADPDGIRWSFAKFLEEVSPAEMDRRMKEMMAKGGPPGIEKSANDHAHAHEHDAHATHTHAHDHAHHGEAHAHEHVHSHDEHGHAHEGGEHHAHDHKHEHDHAHGGEHGHEGHDHGHEGHDHGHEGHDHSH